MAWTDIYLCVRGHGIRSQGKFLHERAATAYRQAVLPQALPNQMRVKWTIRRSGLQTAFSRSVLIST